MSSSSLYSGKYLRSPALPISILAFCISSASSSLYSRYWCALLLYLPSRSLILPSSLWKRSWVACMCSYRYFSRLDRRVSYLFWSLTRVLSWAMEDECYWLVWCSYWSFLALLAAVYRSYWHSDVNLYSDSTSYSTWALYLSFIYISIRFYSSKFSIICFITRYLLFMPLSYKLPCLKDTNHPYFLYLIFYGLSSNLHTPLRSLNRALTQSSNPLFSPTSSIFLILSSAIILPCLSISSLSSCSLLL